MIVRFNPRSEDLERLQVGTISYRRQNISGSEPSFSTVLQQELFSVKQKRSRICCLIYVVRPRHDPATFTADKLLGRKPN